MKNKRIIFRVIFYTALAIVALGVFRPFWHYKCPPWAAYRARHRINLVHPGMTDSQVFQTLGLSSYGFSAYVSGSGDPHAYPANYLLWPGDILYCRWDVWCNPPVLVEARFKNRLDDR